jgi:hypothetical protein
MASCRAACPGSLPILSPFVCDSGSKIAAADKVHRWQKQWSKGHAGVGRDPQVRPPLRSLTEKEEVRPDGKGEGSRGVEEGELRRRTYAPPRLAAGRRGCLRRRWSLFAVPPRRRWSRRHPTPSGGAAARSARIAAMPSPASGARSGGAEGRERGAPRRT